LAQALDALVHLAEEHLVAPDSFFPRVAHRPNDDPRWYAQAEASAFEPNESGEAERIATLSGIALLTDASALVARGWCQGSDARGPEGEPVEPWDERAESWSLLGAIVAVLEREARERDEVPLEQLAAALYALAEVIEIESLAAWNDAPGRSQADVLRTLGGAEQVYEPPWPASSGSPPS
jgi:hypothetical protein